MKNINEEDWGFIGGGSSNIHSDDYEPLIAEGMRLCNEIYSLLSSVTHSLQAEMTGP